MVSVTQAWLEERARWSHVSCRQSDQLKIVEICLEKDGSHTIGYVAGRMNRGIAYVRKLSEELEIIADRRARLVGSWLLRVRRAG